MTAEQVIGCAPFRLQNPRPLTPYEWTVVRNAVQEGFSRAGAFFGSPDTQAAVGALVGAIGYQNTCPSWRMSAFNPAPAVAVLPYECLGEWFARLDYPTRQRALSDISYGSLLCAPNPPWGVCAGDQRRVANAWEGAPQLGILALGIEACAEPRARTAYVPTTVEQIVQMFRTLGGQIPSIIEQGYSMLPPAARQRSLLLGVQLRSPQAGLPAILAGATNPIVLAQALIEEVSIIWAPGRGSSLTSMLSGNVDPAKLIELATAMMPDVLGSLQIPSLPDLTSILSTLGGLLGTMKQVAKAPGSLHGIGGYYNALAGAGTPTSGKTGVPVVDTPGDKLDKTAPIPGVAVIDTTFSPIKMLAVAALTVGAAALILHYA